MKCSHRKNENQNFNTRNMCESATNDETRRKLAMAIKPASRAPASPSPRALRRASTSSHCSLEHRYLNGTRFKKTETCSLPLLDTDPLGTAVLKVFSHLQLHTSTRYPPPLPSSRSSSTTTSSASFSMSTIKRSSCTPTTSAPASSWTSARCVSRPADPPDAQRTRPQPFFLGFWSRGARPPRPDRSLTRSRR